MSEQRILTRFKPGDHSVTYPLHITCEAYDMGEQRMLARHL